MNQASFLSTKATVSRSEAGGRLFRKYIILFCGVVCAALVASSTTEIWNFYNDQKALLIRAQRHEAETAAVKIEQFFKQIEGQIGWTTQLPWSPEETADRHVDAVRLLRQMPAIVGLRQVDRSGHEQLRVSTTAPDVMGSQADFGQDRLFSEAVAKGIYYGPVYFLRDSEPHMNISLAGPRLDAPVSIADINLITIVDIISQIRMGAHGQAYLIDGQGRLIAHPDASLVRRNTDLSSLQQVRLALENSERRDDAIIATNVQGHRVLSAYATVVPLGWAVFVELPVNEAYSSLYASLALSAAMLLAALALAIVTGFFFARRMVAPIHELRAGAARIGSGDLGLRLSIRTGDELEALGEQFNAMAARLQDSYATLERKVEERTQELELANLAKSRFLAAASHDLRQPLHALGLFVAQLRTDMDETDRNRTIERVSAALAGTNELFNALLDISKLDAGVLNPDIVEFPVAHLLQRMDTTFTAAFHEKGLSFRVIPCAAWVQSDFILLERVMLNLVSNAMRYTDGGGVLVGCRRRAGVLRIEIWDTGVGIPDDQQQKIFGEFYRLHSADGASRGGLGLGLAIVERLCKLLNHPIELTSQVGAGSRFAVTVPLVAARPESFAQHLAAPLLTDTLSGKLILVIDDDLLALESMGGLLRNWNCRVVTAGCYHGALADFKSDDPAPDAIICDYHLADGQSGIDMIDRLHRRFKMAVPAVLISADTNIDRQWGASEGGYHLLHKPVSPIALRTLLIQLCRKVEIES